MMSGIEGEQVLVGLENLQIDDSKVNKMRRRRSSRIQIRTESKKQSDIHTDLVNNNVPAIDNGVADQVHTDIDYRLERENIHFQRAQKTFTYITQNEYLVRLKKSDHDNDGTACGCSLTLSQIERGELGCGKNCLNRVMSIECDPDCALGKLCTNQRFRKFQNAPCTVFITENKGFGLFASADIPKDAFIMEFVGEVVSMTAFKKRSKEYEKQKLRHCYVMSSAGANLIDATKKGNLTRFLNHSCDPNAETQKWTVNGVCRIGIFSKRIIKAFEEITINYQFERFG